MCAEESVKSGLKKKTKTRVLKWGAGLAVVLILLVVFALPWFVSSERGRRIILARINNSIDGEVDFAGLTMGWWRGVGITDISFSDVEGRISVRVRQIITRPHYSSFLTGSLSLGETEIFEPQVEVNLLQPQAQKQQGLQEEKSRPGALPIKRAELVVRNGGLKVTDSRARSVELSEINTRLNLKSPRGQADFDVDLAVVDGGKKSKITANGRVAPGREWRWKETSGELAVEVNDLELGSLAPIFAMGGFEIEARGRISGNVEGEIRNGRLEKMKAEVEGKNLDVNAAELTGGRMKTGRLGVDVKLARAGQMINIESFDIESDWLKANGRGAVPTTISSLDEFLETDSSLTGSFELDAAQLFAQMPKVFRLKEETVVTSGILRGDIETLLEDGRRKIKGQVNLERLGGIVGGVMVALSEPVRAEAEITSDKGGVRFDKLGLSSAFAKVNCSGTSELLRYRGSIDLARFQSELGQFADMKGYTVAGEVSGEGEVSVLEDEIAMTGSPFVRDFRLSSAEGVSAYEPMADAAFSATVERGKGILDISFLKAKASLGEVNVKDAVLPLGEDAVGEMSLDISASNVDLQKVRPFAVLFAGFPKEMQLSGMVETKMGIRSKKGKYHVATDRTNIKNLKVNYPGKAPFEQREVSVNFDAEVDTAEKAIAVKGFQLESDQVKIRGDFSKLDEGGKSKLESRGEYEYNWAAVTTVAGPILPEGLVLEGKRKDTISFTSEYPKGQIDKLLENLSAKGKTGFAKASYFGLNLGPTELDVQVENGLLRIAPFSTAVNNGQLNFAGEADFKQKPSLLKTPGPVHVLKNLQINDEMARRLLRYLNPVFANAVSVSGVANFESEKLAIPLSGGTKEDIEVIGTVYIQKLRLETSELLGQILSTAGISSRGVDITIRPTRFILQKGFLKYDDMQMDVGDNPVNFGGVIGLDKSLNMTVILPYTTAGKTTRVGKEVEGTRISLPLKGTVDKPELDLGKLLEEQLKQQLIKELEGVLKK